MLRVNIKNFMFGCIICLLMVMMCGQKTEASYVSDRIGNVLAKYPNNSYFSSTGGPCGPGQTNYGYGNYCTYCQLYVMDSNAAAVCGNGDSCNAFAKYVFYNVFGKNPRACSSKSGTNLNEIAQEGDFVECYTGGVVKHYLIYIGSAGGNSFYAYEANVGTENLVKYRQLHCSSYGNLWDSYVVYHENTHTHSYSSSVTKAATCTSEGVRTYTCSCGSKYTEAIAKTSHNYVNTVVAPTLTQKGYTQHTCSICKNSYNDNYINPPTLGLDGWYTCSSLPSGISYVDYTIEYNNIYEKIQASSPGTDWKQVSTVKDEWQNSGSAYSSESDLPTSNSRILVSSYFYHFCGPNAGNEGNYEQSGKFVHYDSVDASLVNVTSSGMDNTHPYYLLSWKSNGGVVWCGSGNTCDGAYGQHGARCKAWYKTNTYQDRVHVVQYKYQKESGWTGGKDAKANSVKIRFQKKDDISDEIVDEVIQKIEDEKTTDDNPESVQPSAENQTEDSSTDEMAQKLEKPSSPYNSLTDKATKSGKVSGVKLKNEKGKKLTVTWKAEELDEEYDEIECYEVQIATNKNFKKGLKKKNAYVSNSVTFKKLKKGKTYYVRVRVWYDEYGPWSEVKKIKIKK